MPLCQGGSLGDRMTQGTSSSTSPMPRARGHPAMSDDTTALVVGEGLGARALRTEMSQGCREEQARTPWVPGARQDGSSGRGSKRGRVIQQAGAEPHGLCGHEAAQRGRAVLRFLAAVTAGEARLLLPSWVPRLHPGQPWLSQRLRRLQLRALHAPKTCEGRCRPGPEVLQRTSGPEGPLGPPEQGPDH